MKKTNIKTDTFKIKEETTMKNNNTILSNVTINSAAINIKDTAGRDLNHLKWFKDGAASIKEIAPRKYIVEAPSGYSLDSIIIKADEPVMEEVDIKTRTYRYNDEYYVDIVTTDDLYIAYLYNKEYDIRIEMFGSSKQQSYEEFLIIVKANVEEYIPIHKHICETIYDD